jgi:hypothetical protein
VPFLNLDPPVIHRRGFSQRSKTDQAASAVRNTLSRPGGSEPVRMRDVRAS